MKTPAWLIATALACTPSTPTPAPTPTPTPAAADPQPTPTVEPPAAPPTPPAPVTAPPVATPPTPPPTPATAELPRFVAAPAFPDNVFAATVDPQTHSWTVGIVDWDIVEESPIAAQLMADELALDVLPPGYPALPVGWAEGDTWTLVTRAGTVPKTVVNYGISISEASGQLFVHVRLGPAPKGAKGPGIALRGTPGKAPPHLVRPTVAKPASIDADALARIHDAMVTGFDDESRPLIRGAKLREADVELFAGRFPGGRTHVAFVRHIVPGDEDAAMLSAMLFVGAAGKIEFVRQADVLGEMKLVGLVDLDGDAIDEILYEDSYHEGWYVELLHWKGDAPERRILTGDGL